MFNYCLALYPRVSLRDHLAWGRGSWPMCVSCICLFVCFACVSFCPLYLSLGVGVWLRFMIDFSINCFADKKTDD